jgi:hypothetical protein
VRSILTFCLAFAWGLALLAGFAGDVCVAVALRVFDVSGPPVPNDYGSFWAAGYQALHGQAAAAYDFDAHWIVERALFGPDVPQVPWMYPPLFLLVVTPLALLPFGWSRLCWLALTLAAYLAATLRISRERGALLFALAYTGVCVNAVFAQNGVLSAALLTGGLLSLESNPLVAGALLGALAYKPQLGLLVPIALIAGRHWRAFGAAATTVLASAALAALLFGPEVWPAYAGSLPGSRRTILDGTLGLSMITLYSEVRRLGGAPALAFAAQALGFVASALLVAWAWRRPGPLAHKGALLAALVPLATPYAYQYDLVLLSLPIGLLLAECARTRFLAWEQPILLCAFVFPLVCFLWERTFLLGPLVSLGLVAVLVQRLGAGVSPAPAALAQPSR